MVKFRYFSGAALFLLASLSLPLTAEAKLSLSEQAQLERLKLELAGDDIKSRAGMVDPIVTGFIKLEKGATVNEIESLGATIINQVGDIYIVAMPSSIVEPLSDLKGVEGVQLSRMMKKHLDSARKIGNVDGVISGEGLDGYSFDGSDVLIGLFDTGLDPNNPNFGDRVEVVFHYPAPSNNSQIDNPSPTEYYGDKVKSFTTDASTEYHGTHVLGIMTGSAEKLDQSVTYTNMGLVRIVRNGANPYKGVAPGARVMVACTPYLYNAFIIDGVKRMIDYAKEQGQIPVINLSIGNNIGAHDGTDYAAAAISELAKEAVIVISSGNEGDLDIALTKTFTSTNNTLTTLLYPVTATYKSSYPEMQVWGATGDKLTVNVVYINTKTGEVVKKTPVTTVLSNDGLASDAVLSQYFTSGRIYAQGQTDSNSGRYVVTITNNGTAVTSRPNSSVYIGVEVIGTNGQRADVFVTDSDNFMLSDGGLSNLDKPDGNMSINTIACGKGLLAVGASVANPGWATFGSSGKGEGPYAIPGYQTPDVIAPFSSFGELIDGRRLPQVVAPGMMIKSSINSYYTDRTANYELSDPFAVATLTENGRKYVWVGEMGTSMAAPFVTGVVALWQQASMEINKKSMTPEEVIDLAQRTAISDQYTTANPLRAGAGKINAYDGIKEILSSVSSIGKITIDDKDADNAFIYSIQNRNLNVFVAGATAINMSLYTVAGQQVHSVSVKGNDLTHSLDNLAAGIYVLNVTTPEGGNYSKKISLR